MGKIEWGVCDEFGQHTLITALFVYIIVFMTTEMHPPTNNM